MNVEGIPGAGALGVDLPHDDAALERVDDNLVLEAVLVSVLGEVSAETTLKVENHGGRPESDAQFL